MEQLAKALAKAFQHAVIGIFVIVALPFTILIECFKVIGNAIDEILRGLRR